MPHIFPHFSCGPSMFVVQSTIVSRGYANVVLVCLHQDHFGYVQRFLLSFLFLLIGRVIIGTVYYIMVDIIINYVDVYVTIVVLRIVVI